jgi:DNA-binding transcriptional MocR family regulator
MGLPALDAFPRKVWSRLVARHARGFTQTDMAYPNPAGYAPLREAIAGYLATSRGVRCTAGQILITNGYQDALNLVAGVLLQRRQGLARRSRLSASRRGIESRGRDAGSDPRGRRRSARVGRLQPGGMHLIARFGNSVSDIKLAQLTQAGGLSAEALSRRATTPACGQGLLLGFANIAEADALATCHRLQRLIGKSLGDQT